jgi:2-hydroxychromene-2-carboxylate isomerase
MDFWCELASPCTYLSACRLDDVPGVRWRPFSLAPIFQAQGWSTSPFLIYEAKGRYMWRDVEREAARLGIAWHKPFVFPRNSVPAAKLAASLPWEVRPRFIRRVMEANFVEDRDIAQPGVLAHILDEVGLAVTEVPGALRRETEEAIRLGIFGAPSFTIGGELYWGNDRLDQALEMHQRSPR